MVYGIPQFIDVRALYVNNDALTHSHLDLALIDELLFLRGEGVVGAETFGAARLDSRARDAAGEEQRNGEE